MKLTFEDVPSLPIGPYVGRFLGAKPQDDKGGTQKRVTGRDGQPLPLGLIWEWQVVGGEYDGQIADRLTGKTPTAKSTCGGFLMTVCGVGFNKGHTVDLESMVGTMWRFRIEAKDSSPGTRVSVIGLARAYDLERPAPQSMGGQHAPPPLDDDQAGAAPPAEERYYVCGPDKKVPPVVMTGSEVMASIGQGDILPGTRVCVYGATAWTTAGALFPVAIGGNNPA